MVGETVICCELLPVFHVKVVAPKTDKLADCPIQTDVVLGIILITGKAITVMARFAVAEHPVIAFKPTTL